MTDKEGESFSTILGRSSTFLPLMRLRITTTQLTHWSGLEPMVTVAVVNFAERRFVHWTGTPIAED